MEKFKGRREDDRLLTGQGRYTDDWTLPGQLYGHFLRSDRAHAEIVSLETRAAAAAPGVAAVFAGKDTAHFKDAPPLVRFPGRGGMKMLEPHRPALATDRVRHVGQEVALVVATSPQAAHDAAELIEVDYRDLPVVVEVEDALKRGAPQLYSDIPGNLSFDFEYGNEAAVDEAIAKAAHLTRVELDSNRIAGNPMEPKSCVASYDARTDSFDVYAPCQGLNLLVPSLGIITGVPPGKIRLHSRDVGGGFGVRSDAYLEYAALMHATRTLGKPVKWTGTRAETLVSDHHGRGARLIGALALDRDGRFLALKIEWLVNAGAYLSHPGPFINTMAPGFHAVNAYRIPAMYGRHKLVMTNTTPTTAYRGAGRPNVSLLAERLVEQAAREMRIDRIELRRRNLIPREAFPYQTPMPPAKYDSGDPPGQLERALDVSHWKDFEKRKGESHRRGKLRGIACCVFIEPSGGGGSPKEQAALRFGSSGNIELYTASGPSGQGHETVYPQIAAQVLGIAAERITLHPNDPLGPRLMGDGTIGSRSTMAAGSAVLMSAREVLRKASDLAAKDMEVAPADIEFSKGTFRVKGTDLSASFEEVAKRHGSALDSTGELPPPRSFPGGAHVAEVEVDPETGEIDILRYIAVDDCGRILNHALLEGQFHGGIVQGLGQALGEHAVYDPDSGQLLTGTFMDYAMPRADEQPSFELLDHSVPSPGNPLGVKGAGEAGTTGAVPTIANAVLDALRPLGIEHLDFPFAPRRVWEALTSGNENSGRSRAL